MTFKEAIWWFACWCPSLHEEINQNEYCRKTKSRLMPEINAIEKKLFAYSKVATLIDDSDTGATDAYDLIPGHITRFDSQGSEPRLQP